MSVLPLQPGDWIQFVRSRPTSTQLAPNVRLFAPKRVTLLYFNMSFVSSQFASITRHSPTSIESMLVTHSVDDSALDTCVLVHIEPQSHTGYQLYMNC